MGSSGSSATTRSVPRRRSRLAVGLALVLTGLTTAWVGTAPAAADSMPADPTNPATPETVTVDRLPTVQIDGVAWQQLVVGNTVYVAGQFGWARPAGSAPGQNQVARNNILAYDLTTGELKTSFNPNLNGQALALAAAPDGSRLYVGGEFTKVGAVNRYRIAALDPQTGAAITSFNAGTDAPVRAIAATDTTVYFGGTFSTANSTARTRLAAASASNGALLSWAPKVAGGRVNALAISPGGDKIVAAGNFTTLNGSGKPGYGMGAVDATTGTTNLPWAVNNVVRNAGTDSSITSLASDGTRLYGSGYIYGTGGTLEGSFSANWSDGSVYWIEDCHGDTYGVYPSPTAVYIAGHPHYCLNLGGYGETDPPQRALAFSKAATGKLTADTKGYPSFTGQPSPTLQNFFPQLTTGTASGQSQAAWAVTGTEDYVLYGGEFTQVNGIPQQGLVRFATKEIAPNVQGPKATGANFVPTATAPAGGQAKVSWTANYDYDNANLTYRVYRDGEPTPVHTTTQASAWWNRPTLSFTDTGVPAGSHSYRVEASDPFGNTATSASVSVEVPSTSNDAPTASFTTAVSSRTVRVDASGSTDSDGSITGYSWSWGDGQTSTGATASHTYDNDGTYTVQLTVTDDGAASGSTTRSVTVAGTAGPLVSDTFTRTATSGFGSADTGGAWSGSGSTALGVSGGQGTITVSKAGTGPTLLVGPTATSVDLTAAMTLSAVPNSGGAYFGTIGRRVGTADYRLKVKVSADSSMLLYVTRTVGGTETTVKSVALTGKYTPGTRVNTRFQVTGTAPTTLRARVWLGTAAQPTTWQVSTTDSTSGLQAAGNVGLHTYVSGGATNPSWVFRVDDFVATPL